MLNPFVIFIIIAGLIVSIIATVVLNQKKGQRPGAYRISLTALIVFAILAIIMGVVTITTNA